MDSEKGSPRRPDTVYRSTGAAPGALVCCGVVAVLGLAAAVSGVAVLAGLVGALLFGPIACEMGWAALRRRPELVIGDEAIAHPALGHIAWSSVDHVRVRRDGRGRVLEIVLRGGSMRACPCVPVSALPVRVDAVLGAIRAHRPDVLIGGERVVQQGAPVLGRTVARGGQSAPVDREDVPVLGAAGGGAARAGSAVLDGPRRRAGLRGAIRRRPARPARPGNR
ncbi:hypothetical protein REK76_13190 [Nocardia farcinica]|uniref:hypothetical protein n=1 Tax=Nocardia farcinica TaxID=37329 RepID=UPI00311D78B3